MGISINTNIAATNSSYYLARNHAALQKSLDRLSSGRRITEPADDAGGLAVSMKLNGTIDRLNGAASNVASGISLLQVQDGILDSVGKIVSRMGELKGLYSDVIKDTNDKATYDAEFTDLKAQITALAGSTFNGTALFSTAAGGATLNVYIDENGTSSSSPATITQSGLVEETNVKLLLAAANLATEDTDKFSGALSEIAKLRADNGGEVKRLMYAQENIQSQVTNLTAANGRIMDVDVATESSNLARQQVLVQASAAMTAQAKLSTNVALVLLQ